MVILIAIAFLHVRWRDSVSFFFLPAFTVGFRVLGVRVLGFKGLGFRGLGFGGLAFRV